jgi:hypothetical protein
MRSASLLILLIDDPYADDPRQAPLDNASASRSCLIEYGLAEKLAWEDIAIAHRRPRLRPRFAEPAVAQQFLQSTQTIQIIKSGYLAQPLEAQPCIQYRGCHQQRPGRGREPGEPGVEQFAQGRRDQFSGWRVRQPLRPQYQSPGAALLQRREKNATGQQFLEGLPQVERLPRRVPGEPVAQRQQGRPVLAGFPAAGAFAG